MKFKRANMGKGVEDPYRCLALSVIQQAFLDGDKTFLKGEEPRGYCWEGWVFCWGDCWDSSLDFWLDAAELNEDAFKDAVSRWFPRGWV